MVNLLEGIVKKMCEEDGNEETLTEHRKELLKIDELHVELEEMNYKTEFHQNRERMDNLLLSMPLTVSQN